MPSVIWEKLRQGSERCLFCEGTNPFITVDEPGHMGEPPSLCGKKTVKRVKRQEKEIQRSKRSRKKWNRSRVLFSSSPVLA